MLVIRELSLEHLLCNLNREFGYLASDFTNGVLLLGLNLLLGIREETCAFFACFILCFLYNGIAGFGSLLEESSLLLASFLQDGFTFFWILASFSLAS